MLLKNKNKCMIIIRDKRVAEIARRTFKFDAAKLESFKQDLASVSNPGDRLNLFINTNVNLLRKLMFAKNLDAQEIARMILNEDNPKTMDYYFMKLLDVRIQDATVGWCGSLNGNLKSFNTRVTSSFNVLGRARPKSYERGQIYFTLDIHEDQIFPKSRTFRICSKRSLPVTVINPRKGQLKQVTYGSGFTASYLETPTIEVPKNIILYCRNAWERKGDIKPSTAKKQKEEVVEADAIAEVVSVI